MTSSRQKTANKANAQRSTGPKSGLGKARSRLNAVKHGLAISASAIPALAPDIAHLTQMLAGADEIDPAVRAAAARVAEASIDLLRARRARTDLLDRMSQGADFLQPIPAVQSMPARLPPYRSSTMKERIMAIHDRTIDALHAADAARYDQYLAYIAELRRVKQNNEARKKQKTRQHSDWDRLDKLDRYERRALSRRQTAIKVLDDLIMSRRLQHSEGD